ncbi:MAG: hypothetical protein GYB65_22070 [Chloroflexi bacterium]|nr:hypothetical protein [Chloroflexota bacterium]
MTRRPDPYNQAKLEETLLELGCPESFLSTITSNYRLFVPLLFAELGEEAVFKMVYAKRHELELGDQETAWRTSVKYLVAWAEHVLKEYKAKRKLKVTYDPNKQDDDQQPRLL